MRFTFVSLVLLALSHSVVPGVHGVPPTSDHTGSLAVRQGSLLDDLVDAIKGLVQGITGSLLSNQDIQQVEQTIQQILKGLQANSLIPRADPTSSALTTTASAIPSGSIVGNASSVSSSTPQASSTHSTRMRRQPASAHLVVMD